MGFAWFGSISDGTLAKVDTIGANLVEVYSKQAGTGCAGAYGIAIDVRGRIWQAGFDCNTADRFDPATNSWASIDFAGAGRGATTRGIAPDLAGTVWVAHTGGFVTRFDAETMQEIEAFQLPHHLGGSETVNNTIGVGIDRNGSCWAVSINQGYLVGTATRIQPGGAMVSYPVGLMPYTYSDFTGFGLTTVTRPSGWYNMIVAGCEDRDPAPPDIVTDWQRLTWNELEPVGTNVRMRFKVADTVADLASAAWWGPYDDPDVDLDALGVPNSNFMMLQVLLSSTSAELTPSFVGFDLTFDCGGGIIPN
jgi:streptogramin lyase